MFYLKTGSSVNTIQVILVFGYIGPSFVISNHQNNIVILFLYVVLVFM
jgi:hypothetical protein